MFKSDKLKRMYCSGKTEIVNFRFPIKLKKRLQEFAEENGRTTTDVVITALDQFVQQLDEADPIKKKPRK